MLTKDIAMATVHDYVGQSLAKALPAFRLNKANKILKCKGQIMTSMISWHCVKYGQNSKLILSFHANINHHKTDHDFDRFFSKTALAANKTTANIIWNNSSGLGTYEIYSMDQLCQVMNEVSESIESELLSFFDQFRTDYDFYKYLCIDKKLFSRSDTFALKRIILCYDIEKTKINDIHQYNLDCCSSAPSGTDIYLKGYLQGIEILKSHLPELDV